jgi:hypothetical protein
MNVIVWKKGPMGSVGIHNYRIPNSVSQIYRGNANLSMRFAPQKTVSDLSYAKTASIAAASTVSAATRPQLGLMGPSTDLAALLSWGNSRINGVKTVFVEEKGIIFEWLAERRIYPKLEPFWNHSVSG